MYHRFATRAYAIMACSRMSAQVVYMKRNRYHVEVGLMAKQPTEHRGALVHVDGQGPSALGKEIAKDIAKHIGISILDIIPGAPGTLIANLNAKYGSDAKASHMLATDMLNRTADLERRFEAVRRQAENKNEPIEDFTATDWKALYEEFITETAKTPDPLKQRIIANAIANQINPELGSMAARRYWFEQIKAMSEMELYMVATIGDQIIYVENHKPGVPTKLYRLSPHKAKELVSNFRKNEVSSHFFDTAEMITEMGDHFRHALSIALSSKSSGMRWPFWVERANRKEEALPLYDFTAYRLNPQGMLLWQMTRDPALIEDDSLDEK